MIEDTFYQTFDKLYQGLEPHHRSLLLTDVQSGLFHVIHTSLVVNSDTEMLDQYKEFVNTHSAIVDRYDSSYSFTKSIFNELVANNNKLSKTFIDSIVATASVTYLKPTSNMRLCVLTLPTGHEVLGKAQVLDAINDNEELGNQVAYNNAVNELWSLCGAIAKLYI